MNTTTRGHLAAAFCMTVWASTFVLTKILLRSFTAVNIVLLRAVVAYITLIVLSPRPVKTGSYKKELLYVFAGAFGIPGYFILQNTGLAYTTATNSSIILNTAPLFIVILTWLILKDKSGIHLNFFIGFVMAITGIALISLGGSEGSLSLGAGSHLFGDLLTVGAALMWGFYTLLKQKISETGASVLKTTRRIYFWGLVWMVPCMIFFGGGAATGSTASVFAGLSSSVDPTMAVSAVPDLALSHVPGLALSHVPGLALSAAFSPALTALADPVNLISLLFLGIFASAGCFMMWNYAVRTIGTVKSSVYIYGQPVVSVAASFIILKEKITPMIILGIVLTIVGVILSGHRRATA